MFKSSNISNITDLPSRRERLGRFELDVGLGNTNLHRIEEKYIQAEVYINDVILIWTSQAYACISCGDCGCFKYRIIQDHGTIFFSHRLGKGEIQYKNAEYRKNISEQK